MDSVAWTCDTFVYSKSYRRMHKKISHVLLFQDFEAIELGSVLYFVYEKQSQLCSAVCEKFSFFSHTAEHN